MVIAEPQVSAHHAEIGFRQGHYYLRDLRSTNGTWVNQQRIEAETMLKANDAIRFDEFAYTFFEPERQIEGTIMRDFGKETMIRESVRPRQASFRAGRDGHAGYRKRCRRSVAVPLASEL